MATRGSIVKRERPAQAAFYEVTISKGTDPLTGRRLRESKAFKTRKEAQKYLSARLAEIDRGTAVDKSKMSVAELMTHWLHVYAVHNVSAMTLDGYRNTIERHIIPALGKLAVQSLTPTHLSTLYARKLSDGCSPRVVVLMHRRLSQALKMAAEHGLVSRNVAESVKAPKDPKKEQPTWSVEEVQRFLQVAKDSCYGPIWVLSLATGMRKGELLGLRWCDVDGDNDTVQVRQTQGVIRGKTYLKPTMKTEAGKRTVTIPASVMTLLHEHRCRQMAAGHCTKTGLVFTSKTGTPINPRNLSRQCDDLMAKARVPRISVHCQRHTHISQLLLAGVSVRAVSERVGHANVSVTLDTYSHLTREARREAADVAERMLFG